MEKKNYLYHLARLGTHVFHDLGTGHPECVYHRALVHEMQLRPSSFSSVESERAICVTYRDTCEGTNVLSTCEADVLFVCPLSQQRVLLEIKAHAASVQTHHGFHAQVCKYVRCLQRNGLAVDRAYLINFRQPGASVYRDTDLEITEVDLQDKDIPFPRVVWKLASTPPP